MCIEMRCVYRVVSYELCNNTIIRPFKGDEWDPLWEPDKFNHKRDELKQF